MSCNSSSSSSTASTDNSTTTGLFVTVGVTGTILTSPDGITWTSRTSGTTKRLDKVSSTIRSLKKLSNKTNYVYDQVEIYNGLSSLIIEINDLANAFGLDSSEIDPTDSLYSEIKEIKEELTSLKIKLKRQEWNKRQ